MLNWIWLALVVIGVVLGGLFGRLGGEEGVVESAFAMAKTAVFGIVLPLTGFWMMWLGFMRLAEKAGLIDVLAKALAPLMRLLFPDVPREHPAMGAMIMNMSANILGLGNSATPFGLKAMEHLETLNPQKGTATNAMCTFLAINTSSVTLIPATAIGLLSINGIANPYAIVGTAIGATLCSTMVAIMAVKFFEKLPFFRVQEAPAAVVDDEAEETGSEKAVTKMTPIRIGIAILMILVIAVIGWFEFKPESRDAVLETFGIAGLVEPTGEVEPAAKEATAAATPDKEPAADPVPEVVPKWRRVINAFSIIAIPFVFLFFTGYAALKKVPVYEEFVEGAKDGWAVAVRVMPFLVGMLIALGIFRASGALSLMQRALSPILKPLGFDPELLPMALIRPLSGGGSQGVLVEILANPEISEPIKYTAATMFGSTETTFYVLAVYFGSVAIRKTRHALAAGLLADLAGVIAAVTICRLVFGS
ncbi:UNVERIFIED_CONTAM: hypothetical protein GTU68_016504 [Idotea baltica]|nr:hypothetical protein [Idotea baltica]